MRFRGHTAAWKLAAIGLNVIFFVLAAGCTSMPRVGPEALAERQRVARLEVQAQRATFSAKFLQRALAKIDSTPAAATPPPLDILILSGGGQYGAFGVGVLQGWTQDGPLPQPQFDVVTGVSTGALIGPFAFLGTEDSIGRVDNLYRATDRNFAVLRDIFYFLPWRESFYDNSALRRRVHEEITEPLARRIAEEYTEGRLLLIGTTDIELGRMRVWDYGLEAERALATTCCDKLANILLASAALPAAFPPVAIDEALYVDGGISQQAVSGLDLGQFRDVMMEAKHLRPGSGPLALRMWVIVNGPLDDATESTALRWDSVAKRSLRVLMTYSKRVTLRHLEFGTALLAAETGMAVEFRYIAVPDEFSRPPAGVLFDQPFMLKLGELGRRLGAAASSWRTTVGPVEEFDAETFRPDNGMKPAP